MPHVTFIDVPVDYRAVAEINSISTDPSITWTIQPYPIVFDHPTQTGDFGIVTQCTSWTDIAKRTIHLSIKDGNLEDPTWELHYLVRK